MTIRQFDEQFPDDDACLEHIFRVRYGERHQCSKCGKDAKYYRVKKRRCYECEHCGYQVFPTVGTPFAKSRTPLKTWFYVMFMFCSTRNGVSGKEIQRATGVTYKTAWRMGHMIRAWMGYVDGDEFIGGGGMGDPYVEVDKTFIGGKGKRRDIHKKAVVLGMIERGGDVITRVIPTRRANHVIPHIYNWVHTGTKVNTDDALVFDELHQHGYRHRTVNHSKKEYVRGAVHTNTIEAFWANLKRGIKGTHVWVSKKHLQNYLVEFEFRHNLRASPHLMLDALLLAFPQAVALSASSGADDQSVV